MHTSLTSILPEMYTTTARSFSLTFLNSGRLPALFQSRLDFEGLKFTKNRSLPSVISSGLLNKSYLHLLIYNQFLLDVVYQPKDLYQHPSIF